MDETEANVFLLNMVNNRNCVECPVMPCERGFMDCRARLLDAALAILAGTSLSISITEK